MEHITKASYKHVNNNHRHGLERYTAQKNAGSGKTTIAKYLLAQGPMPLWGAWPSEVIGWAFVSFMLGVGSFTKVSSAAAVGALSYAFSCAVIMHISHIVKVQNSKDRKLQAEISGLHIYANPVSQKLYAEGLGTNSHCRNR